MDEIKYIIILSEANLRNHTTFHYPNHSETVKAADIKMYSGCMPFWFWDIPLCVPFLKIKTIGPAVKRQVVIRPRRVSFSKHQFFFVVCGMKTLSGVIAEREICKG